MSHNPRWAVTLLFLLSSVAAHGADYTMTPATGPAAGGTTVTITSATGDFGTWTYGVNFGDVPATSTTRVDAHTLVAVTPPHLPGVSSIRIFEYDIFLATDLTFTFTGDVPAAYDRVLLPILAPPVQGAFGSEFRTEFSAYLPSANTGQLWGLEIVCMFPPCPPVNRTDETVELSSWARELAPEQVVYDGNPGRFIYLPVDQAGRLSMNLRVFDVSQLGGNLGTELPVVHAAEFVDGYEGMTLVGVPTDSRYRNTLRIYGTAGATVDVTLEGAGEPVTHRVTLREPSGIFEPAYAEFGDFPSSVGRVRVSVAVPYPPFEAPAAPQLWAFVSVTNKETQLITTVTPQP